MRLIHALAAQLDGTLSAPGSGKLLIDDWSFGAKRYRSAKLALTKGQAAALKIAGTANAVTKARH